MWVLLCLLQDSSIAARINDEIITKDDLEAEVRKSGVENPDAVIRKAVLRRLAERILTRQEAKRLGVRVETKEVDEAVEHDVKNFKTRDDFDAWLKKRGITHDQFALEKREEILKQKLMYVKHLWFRKRDADGPAVHEFVTPAEMRAYYSDHPREFEIPETRKIARITLQFQTAEEREEKRKLLQSILRRLEVGADFVAVARAESDLKDSVILDKYDGRAGPFGSAAAERVMKLGKGRTSEILEDTGALHLVRVLAISPAGKESFEDAQPRIQQALLHEKFTANVELLMKDLVKNAEIVPADLFDP
jgi:parvulin-like peptidyl-prolyl isomerase